MKRFGIALVVIGAVGTIASATSRASTVDYNVTGTVKAIRSDTTSYSQFGGIQVGNIFTSRVTLNLSGPNNSNDGPNYYVQNFPPAGYSVSVNGLTFKPLPNTYGFADIHPNWYNNQDLFEFETERSLGMPTGYSTSVNPVGYLYLWSQHDTVFHNQQLAGIPTLNLGSFSEVDFYISWGDTPFGSPVVLTEPDGSRIVAPQFFDIDFSVTTMTQVPEPSAAALALLGLIPLAGWRWRRHSKAK